MAGVTKTSDITDLYTAIQPTGKDGLTVAGIVREEYDSNGNVEYYTVYGDGAIRAKQARDRFPSNLSKKEDGYILRFWSYDTDNVEMLYGQALAELKKLSEPQVSYEVDGYFDTAIGDTVNIVDEAYNPTLYLNARVTEQIRSFTDPTQNKTTFSNFRELQSQIDQDLLDQMQEMVDANRTYTCSVITDNGIVFKNGEGSTTLTASVMDAGNDLTDTMTISWKKDGVSAGTGKSLTVQAADINGKAVYSYDARDTNGILRGVCEVTVTNVSDGVQGEDGEDAILLMIDSSNGDMFKNSAVSTTLTVTVIVGDAWLDTSAKLKSYFGEQAALIWEQKGLGETEFTEIPSTDPRLSDNGFIFTLSTADVETKAVFNCKLDC